MQTREVSVNIMMRAREMRANRQNELLNQYGLPLISFTVVMPGAYKYTPLSAAIFSEGCDEILRCLEESGISPEFIETRELQAGSEMFLAVDMDANALKEMMVFLEDEHPMGRLWDIDVIDRNGEGISRERLGYSKRKCLICDNDAHVCARSRAHSVGELISRIRSIAGELD